MSFDNTIILSPEQLARCGLENPSQALKNLELMSTRLGAEALRGAAPFLLTPLTSAADPDLSLNNLERFVSSLSDGSAFISLCCSRQDVLLSLITVFGASRFLSSFIVSRADESLQLLSAPGYLAHPAGMNVLSERLNAANRSCSGSDCATCSARRTSVRRCPSCPILPGHVCRRHTGELTQNSRKNTGRP